MSNNNMDEVVLTNLVGGVIGTDTLTEAYFKNDARKVIGALANATDINKVSAFIDQTNYNLRGRKITGKSNLGGLQNQMIESFMTPGNVNVFKDHLVSNPNLLEDGMSYPGIEKVSESFNKAKENMPSLQKVA